MSGAHTGKMPEGVEWTEIERSFERWKERMRKGPRTAVLVLVALLPILWLGFGDIGPEFAAGVGTVLLLAHRNRLALEEAREAEGTRESLLLFYRTALDRRIKAVRVDTWLVPALVVVPIGLYFLEGGSRVRLTGTILLVCVMVGIGLRSRFVLLPFLRRERATLD